MEEMNQGLRRLHDEAGLRTRQSVEMHLDILFRSHKIIYGMRSLVPFTASAAGSLVLNGGPSDEQDT
jgi:hypothetical protein